MLREIANEKGRSRKRQSSDGIQVNKIRSERKHKVKDGK